jgi:voltage-gated sodium channel
MYGRLRRLVESDGFEAVIAMLLVLNAGAVAVELLADGGDHDVWLWLFFWISQGIFVAEIALRVASYGPRFGEFFKEGWNVFDFMIVAVALLPDVGPLGMLARLVRVFRALRVLRLASLYFRRERRKGAT